LTALTRAAVKLHATTDTKEQPVSTTATSATFDLDRFVRATEDRDAQTQLSMYGPNATVTIADKVSPPSSPRVLRTREQIEEWLADTNSRDMTHAISHRVIDPTGAAFTETCRYPDGTNVLCATVIELSDGAIANQTIVQVWDEK
jgi:SnoaL-like domain